MGQALAEDVSAFGRRWADNGAGEADAHIVGWLKYPVSYFIVSLFPFLKRLALAMIERYAVRAQRLPIKHINHFNH